MSPDDFRAVLTRLRAYGFADWSRSRLAAIAMLEGWKIDDGEYPIVVVPPPLLRGQLHAGYRGPDFQQLSLTVSVCATLENFHDLVKAGTAEIGHEPPIWGGPGPFVRWRQEPTSPAGHGTSIEITYSRGQIELVLHATGNYEYYWVKSVE